MIVPSGMDGVGGLSQKAIQPGETYKYEFTVWQHGTFMYHSHHDEMTQIALGMTGMIVVHPREPEQEPPDRDFAVLLHEWRIDVGTRRPNPNEMTEFNILTMNAKAFPGTVPLLAKLGIKSGSGSATCHPWTIIQFTCMAMPLKLLLPTAVRYRKALNGRRQPPWLPSAHIRSKRLGNR